MNKFKPFLIPFLLFLLAFFIRIALISKGAYHLDCLHFADKVARSVNTGQIHFLHSHGYPLTAILGAVVFSILNLLSVNDPVYAVHFMSVYFSSLSIPLLYWVTNRFFEEGKLPGLLSALLLALSPIFLSISVYGNSHTLSAFFLLCTVYFILSYLKTDEGKYILWSGFFLGLMGAARLQDFMVILLPVCVFYLYYDCRQNFRARISSLGLCLSIALCTIFLFYIPIMLEPGTRANQLPVFVIFQNEVTRYLSGEFLIYVRLAFDYFMINLSLPGAVFFIMGIVYLLDQKRRLFILLVWILVPMLAYGSLGIIVPRFLTVSLIPTYMIMGYFFFSLAGFNRVFQSVSLLFFIIVVTLGFRFIFPVLHLRHEIALLPDYARWVGHITEKDARIIVGDNWLFINYYGARETLNRPRTINRPIPQNELDKFHRTLDAALADGYSVYITFTGLYTYDPNHQFSDFIHAHYDLEFWGERLTEDWHPGSLVAKIEPNALFRLRAKEGHVAE